MITTKCVKVPAMAMWATIRATTLGMETVTTPIKLNTTNKKM
jgi:hypothetical protein